MAKFDLIPFPDTVSTLFLLESPHKEELVLGYPCAGKTGLRMTRKILPGETNAFGKILSENALVSEKFGIFNSCQFPLGIRSGLNSEQALVARIKDLAINTTDRESIYNVLNNYIMSITNVDSITDYSNRLNKILQNSTSINNLVVCGFIAQAFFKLFFHNFNYSFNVPTKICGLTGRPYTVLFVNHPGDHHKQWIFDKNMLLI
jgi:hypothetical protein